MIELRSTDMAHGGEAVARVDGKAHFVAGAIPGELVAGRVVRDKGSWARVELDRIIEPSPDRVDPPCLHFGTCGGCQWQFASGRLQESWKRDIVAGQLAHLGGIADPPVRDTLAPGTPYGYRNRMDFKVADGRPALNRWRSRSLVPLAECLLLRPELAEIFGRLGDLEGTSGITLRVGVATGERLAVVTGRVPPDAEEWGCAVAHRSPHGLKAVVGDPYLHEVVGGRRFRITGTSFFQNHTAGAEALVELVDEALAVEPHECILDAYAGGGLFAATLGAGAAEVIACEVSPTALRDLRHNLGEAGITAATILRGPVESALPASVEPWDVAVVDPPRQGLGIGGVEAVTRWEPRAIAYVSCDPASLARDTKLLTSAGYTLRWAQPVDLFPQTFHIETVAAFGRS